MLTEEILKKRECLTRESRAYLGPDKLSDGSDHGMEGSAAHAGAVCHYGTDQSEALNECDFPLAQASPRSDQTIRVCVYSRHGSIDKVGVVHRRHVDMCSLQRRTDPSGAEG